MKKKTNLILFIIIILFISLIFSLIISFSQIRSIYKLNKTNENINKLKLKKDKKSLELDNLMNEVLSLRYEYELITKSYEEKDKILVEIEDNKNSYNTLLKEIDESKEELELWESKTETIKNYIN